MLTKWTGAGTLFVAMGTSLRRLTWGSLAACAFTLVAIRGASGETGLEFAEHEHDAGYRAYVAKDYPKAAVHFENAFFSAPKAAELRGAIRARRDAKHYARAGTLAWLARRKYPNDAATMKLAEETIAEATPRAFEVKLTCSIECGVAADGKVVPIERGTTLRFFLDPGPHELQLSFSEGRTEKATIDARAGGNQSLEVTAPPIPPPNPPPDPNVDDPAKSQPTPVRPVPSAKLGPAVFIGAAGVTVLLAGATVFSGLDAQNDPGADTVRTRCVGLGESCPEYQRGRDAQLRTNLLLAGTGIAFVATAVIGVFFTRWSSPKAAKSGSVAPFIGLHTAGIEGVF
jgi:hypothetical protein